METCRHNHILLYAKLHYERSDDVIDDIRRIIAYECAVEKQYVSPKCVYDKMITAYMDYCPDTVSKLLNSLFTPLPDEGKGPLTWWTDACHVDRIVKLMLFDLGQVVVKDPHGCIKLEMGQPDPDILAVKKKEAR